MITVIFKKFSASGNTVARISCRGPCTSSPLILPQTQQEVEQRFPAYPKALRIFIALWCYIPVRETNEDKGSVAFWAAILWDWQTSNNPLPERTDILKASQILAFSILSRSSSLDHPLPSQCGQLGVSARYNRRTMFQGTKVLSVGPWWSRSATPYLY